MSEIHEKEQHDITGAKVEKEHLCEYHDPDGHVCSERANENGFCYWHDKTIIKDHPEDIALLEEYAKRGGLLRGISLQRAQLSNVNLVNHNSKKGYDLSYADFYRANLRGAHLFNIDVRHGSLMKADLRDANMHCAKLQGCNLLGIRLTNTKIDNIEVGNVLLQEGLGKKAEKNHSPRDEVIDLYEQAEEIYRDLRKASEIQGIFTMAGVFLQKELTMRRFQMPKLSARRAMSKTVDLFCGYGEDPVRVVLFSLLLIFISALFYFFFGIAFDGAVVKFRMEQTFFANALALAECLYYSVVTFTTLGYGDFTPIGFSRLVAATEAFTGSFTIALFVVVFVKKMTR